MKIVALESWHTRIPFGMGADPVAFAGVGWTALDTLWVRVVTDSGVEGWGEGFGHACVPATRAAFDTQVAPAALGQDARDIRGLFDRLGRMLHLFGRNGPHLYARSALDIALWDICGKVAGLSLTRLLGAAPAPPRPAYASLLRYGTPARVAAAAERAVAQGYELIKLHEVEVPLVAAAREAIGPDRALMVDVNCPWSVQQAIGMAERMGEYDLTWLEEPVWPPEDCDGLSRVRALGGVPIAGGENVGTLHDFSQMFVAEALDVAQPSVAKIGGVTATIDIAALARAHGVRMVPHCAYFGPGFLASLHLNAALSPGEPFERLFIDMEANPYHDAILVQDGRVAVPDGPGLGREPDMAVLRRYAVGEPTILRAGS